MRYTFNIADFAKQYKKEYDFLFKYEDDVPGFEEAIEFFCSFSKNNPNFVREFCDYIDDLIISDREAAAFAFALEALETEQKPEYKPLDEIKKSANGTSKLHTWAYWANV